ncbi:hypothetical protein AAG906_020207 [Vitis piasezkii]
MSALKESASFRPSNDAQEKSVDKMSGKEFCERFCIPNGVLVELMDGEAMPTEKADDHAIVFSKEQFNTGLRFPLPSLFKEFLHFTQIPPAYIHPNIVRVLMGCSILSMLFNLELSLLEVLFVYSLKKGKNDIFSMAAHLPSLQLVTELPDSTKGGAKGHVLVRGAWAGLLEHPERPFSPNHSLELPGKSGQEGHVVEWIEKTSFARLNKLFEIAAVERHYETLLTARNLMAVVQEPQAEHYVLKDLFFYKEVKEADAEKHRALLDDRERRKNEGTLRKAPGQKRSTASLPGKAPKKEEANKKGERSEKPHSSKGICSPKTLFPSISSGPGHIAGLNHSGPSLPGAERLSLLAEEATSINQPGSPHPDADAAGAICVAALPLMATPMEEMGAESQSLPSGEPSLLALVPVKGPVSKRSRLARNLKSGLIGRLQDRFQEIETEITTETPAAPVVVPDEGAPGETHPAENVEAPDPEEESLSNASSGGILFHPARPLSCLHQDLVSGLRGMAQQHDLFTDLLRTTDYMKAFASRRKNNEDQLRLRLEEAEASLSTARWDNEALRADLAEAKSREESMDARLHEAEDEVALLRGEVRQLQTEVSIEKKQNEDLQLHLSAQKEELKGEFAAEREELEADYQKQVDDMFFFGYRCCMKKNGIKRDVPSIPPGEEKKLLDKPAP